MCGILLVVSAKVKHEEEAPAHEDDARFRLGLSRRGPDGAGEWAREVGDGVGRPVDVIRLGGSLLQLRGDEPSASPLVDGAGNVLCFNGEIFGGLEGLSLRENDSKALLRALATAATEDAIARVLSRLRGPWALIYWQESAQRLWYGRDVVGRRSLLVHRPDAGDPRFVLSSLSPLPAEVCRDHRVAAGAQNEPHFWDEVEAGIYSLQATKDVEARTRVGTDAPENDFTARWQFRRYEWNDCVPSALQEFQRALKLVHSTQQPSVSHANNKVDFEDARTDASVELAVDGLLAALDASVERRVAYSISIGPLGSERSTNTKTSTADVGPAAELGVLFSGGVDSMVIAALADRHCPSDQPIDLLTVCFDGGCSPDRAAAIDGVAELRSACPDRLWRLIFVDAKLTDVDKITPHLTATLHPSDTIMDLNIGAALWLAANGEGWIETGDRKRVAASTDESDDAQSSGQRTNYRSEARVLLLGQGADEQCAGYGRHRTVFRKADESSTGSGWAALSAEMRLDVRRLWVRNLGRDDRLVADHGREARFPYLDEGVMMRLLNTPLSAIADLRKLQGVGDKMLIRGVAERLGLTRAARRVKRAIQFGTRIARESNRREFGSGRRANALSAGQVKLNSTGDGEAHAK